MNTFARKEAHLRSLSEEELHRMYEDIERILSQLQTLGLSDAEVIGKILMSRRMDVCSLSLHLLQKFKIEAARREEYDEIVRTAVRKEKHEPVTNEKRLYAVTTIGSRFGDDRTPIVCDNFEDARAYVESNSMDLWENSYMLAVIEANLPNHPYGLGVGDSEEYWYRWNLETSRYEPIEKPREYANTKCFGIG